MTQPLNFWYEEAGGHTHVRVFLNGGKCGDLCFRNEEFALLRGAIRSNTSELTIRFIPEKPKETPECNN